MRALEDTIASLGGPVILRAVGRPSTPVATIARWRHDAAIIEVAPSDTVQLVMSLVDGPNARGQESGKQADRVRGGSISIFSPSEGVRLTVGDNADVLQLFMPQSYAQAILDEEFECPPMFDLRDQRMQATLMQILVRSAQRSPDDTLLLDEALHRLAFSIREHAACDRARRAGRTSIRTGGLSPRASRRVEDLVGAVLDSSASLSLMEMATEAGLSVTHFVRAFREQNGITPHRYLVRRRIERAISRLRSTDVPIAEVADESGYATPAHFVATFRSVMGVTPGAVRDALAR